MELFWPPGTHQHQAENGLINVLTTLSQAPESGEILPEKRRIFPSFYLIAHTVKPEQTLAWKCNGSSTFKCRSTVCISPCLLRSLNASTEQPLLSKPLNIFNPSKTPLLSNRNWKTGFRKQMGYYCDIMGVYIHIASSERHCNKQTNKQS